MRAGYEIDDIQSLIYAVFNKYTTDTAPWTSWTVKRGFPEEAYFDKQSKPFIYIDTPVLVARNYSQGGQGVGNYELIVGCWDHRDHGGIEEVNIMTGHILDKINNTKALHSKEFDITLGATTYSSTTLTAQGVAVLSGVGPRNLSEAPKDFRHELTLTVRY